MAAERLAIVHVTPFAWEAGGEVNGYVAAVAGELARRGHRVLVLAPSNSPALVRETRSALRTDPRSLLERANGEPVVLGVGEVLPFASGRRSGPPLPVDVARTIEHALGELAPDIVHVHEPFAPSASSAALRHSRALNVASFHAASERALTAQLTRPLSRLLFGRLDARIAGYRAAREVIQAYFPGEYTVILPGAEVPEVPGAEVPEVPGAQVPEGAPRAAVPEPAAGGGRVELLATAQEDRGGLRTLARALRSLPPELDWHATVLSPGPVALPALGGRLRDRVELATAAAAQERALVRAEVVVLASEGTRPAPGVLVRALAAGTVPVASRLPVYDELLCDGERGLEFEPGDVQTLANHLAALIREPALRRRYRRRNAQLTSTFSWPRVADELEQLYGRLAARRRDPGGDPRLRARLAARRLIDVDLHMHTDHSHDCATPVEVLLAEARAKGLGAIAITDHNEISGALDARAKADGITVIVGEEIKTAEQGEVIGLFIEEKIPRGLTLAQTIAEIKRQGGLVYVPHPFDRLHSVPGYEHLLEVLDDVDAIEVFNPRVAISEFNDEAVRFAAKYRIPAGAGSDAHVPQGLGSVRIRMREFDGPGELLQSLRDADIVRNPASLLYVQALKFLQTRALPGAARRASRDRRVRRATGRERRHHPGRRRGGF